MQTLLSIAPFLEGLHDSNGGAIGDFLAQQIRKGQLRMHRFPGAEKAVFLGKDNELYAATVETNAQTEEKETKLQELLSESGKKPCRREATEKNVVTAVQIIGNTQEAFVLNRWLELFSTNQKTNTISRLLPEKKVIQIACSDGHCLALTTDGRVFSHGSNNTWGQLGLGHTNPSSDFQEVQLKMESGSFRFATFVACGAAHSIVICEQESVHGFGHNGCKELGFDSGGKNHFSPAPANLKEQIKKACCGHDYSLFLGSSGAVFGCGTAEKYPLGGNLTGIHPACKLTLPSTVKGRVVDMFTHPCLKVSVLMDEQGTLHVSGNAGQLFGHTNCIQDFFPLKEEAVVLDSYIVCLQPQVLGYQAKFNDESCCDIQVCTADKAEPIHFGWDTIRARSAYLHKMIASNMSEVSSLQDGKKKVTLKEYHWDTYLAYGKYLHENVLDAKPEVLLQLLELADVSSDESGLAHKCANVLLRTVDSENLCFSLEQCIQMKFHALALDLVKQGLTLSNVVDVLNVTAQAGNAGAKDDMDGLWIAYIKTISMAFAAQHASAVAKDAKFDEVIPWIAKDWMKMLVTQNLLKT